MKINRALTLVILEVKKTALFLGALFAGLLIFASVQGFFEKKPVQSFGALLLALGIIIFFLGLRKNGLLKKLRRLADRYNEGPLL